MLFNFSQSSFRCTARGSSASSIAFFRSWQKHRMNVLDLKNMLSIIFMGINCSKGLLYEKFAEKIYPLFKFLPLTVFVGTARYKGLLSEGVKSNAWQDPFYYAAITALVIIGLSLLLKASLNRFLLSVNVFLIGSAALFLIGNQYLLSLLSNYSGAAFFLAILITGIITIFTPEGFTGDTSLSHQQNVNISFLLILGSVGALIWALIFNSSGVIVSITIPFILLRLTSIFLITKS